MPRAARHAHTRRRSPRRRHRPRDGRRTHDDAALDRASGPLRGSEPGAAAILLQRSLVGYAHDAAGDPDGGERFGDDALRLQRPHQCRRDDRSAPAALRPRRLGSGDRGLLHGQLRGWAWRAQQRRPARAPAAGDDGGRSTAWPRGRRPPPELVGRRVSRGPGRLVAHLGAYAHRVVRRGHRGRARRGVAVTFLAYLRGRAPIRNVEMCLRGDSTSLPHGCRARRAGTADCARAEPDRLVLPGHAWDDSTFAALVPSGRRGGE